MYYLKDSVVSSSDYEMYFLKHSGGGFVNYVYSDNLIYKMNWLWSIEIKISNIWTN
jgi:hypothetical protein